MAPDPRPFTLRPAVAADRAAVEGLLVAAALPVGGLDDQFPAAYVVARRGDVVVGVAAAESYGDVALLRSVAVGGSERGHGLGLTLTRDRIAHARQRGARAVYLLTTTAADFFERLGFRRLARGELPRALAAAPEVSSICPSSATCMVLENPMNEAKLDAKLDTSRDPALVPDETRAVVREHYGAVAARTTSCCGPAACTTADTLGYSDADQAAVPDGADLGLGCGNPTAIASLRPGETVLDLGAGGGFDCFLAARQVGPTGKVIGVDMTAAMVTLARGNARKAQATNVDFRLGEIEHLPVADGSVDVILSNCVINLSPEKPAVFGEAFRVLRAGGRLAISDVVAIAPIPAELRTQAAALVGCIGGAAAVDELRAMLGAAGFTDVEVTIAPRSAEVVGSWMPGIERYVASATIAARKPGGAVAACCGPSARA